MGSKNKGKQPKVRRTWDRKPETQVTPSRKHMSDPCTYCDGTGIWFGTCDESGTYVDCQECGGTGLK
jgi:hypothetical protein